MRSTLAAVFVCGVLMAGADQVVSAQSPPTPVPPAQPLPSPPPAVPSVVGAWFLFTEQDGFYEGRLVKMFPKPGQPNFQTCTRCTGDQKNARMLGLTIIDGMKRYGYDYKDGSILDPRDGSVYHAEMTMSPDGKTLAVRGYLFTPILGQTQIWKRLPDSALAAGDIPKELLVPPAH
jgi:hypothetical protein